MRTLALLFGVAALAAGIWILVSSVGTVPVPSFNIQGIEPAEVQVRMSTGRRVFEIRIPEEGWKQALERAGRR